MTGHCKSCSQWCHFRFNPDIQTWKHHLFWFRSRREGEAIFLDEATISILDIILSVPWIVWAGMSSKGFIIDLPHSAGWLALDAYLIIFLDQGQMHFIFTYSKAVSLGQRKDMPKTFSFLTLIITFELETYNKEVCLRHSWESWDQKVHLSHNSKI